jgi:acyl-CoA synthetase (AMP-forming)/AMP-acid ligase II
LDEEGYIFITDRGSDMIISGGVNIYPAEAENVLSGHPGVHDVIVVAVPDKDLGEVAGAVVVPHEDSSATEADLIAFCRGHLSTYKCPRAVVFVDELPRTAMGKVNKNGLGEIYWPSGIPV